MGHLEMLLALDVELTVNTRDGRFGPAVFIETADGTPIEVFSTVEEAHEALAGKRRPAARLV